jgi:hypothetical protein
MNKQNKENIHVLLTRANGHRRRILEQCKRKNLDKILAP